MPRYNWLSESQLQTKYLGDDLRALRAVGVPYTDEMIANASADALAQARSEEHTSELQSLMRISYAVFCLKKKTRNNTEKDTAVTHVKRRKEYNITHLKKKIKTPSNTII